MGTPPRLADAWADWTNRVQIEEMNAINGFANPFLPLLPPGFPAGSSECIKGWRGLSPLALNPRFGTAPGISPQDQVSTEWTHFADAVNVYGRAADGFAASALDNVGVQYGLAALKSGFLTVNEFLDLNANVGSWKNEPEMVPEGCPFLPCPPPSALAGLPPIPDIYPNLIDPWSWRNMALSPNGEVTPAPRRQADPGAIEAAYNKGHVNRGDIQIPSSTFGTISSAPSTCTTPISPSPSDSGCWTSTATPRITSSGLASPTGRTSPADTCFAANGDIIHRGADAWSGILDQAADGPCTTVMPPFTNSRMVAGAPITDDIFKCHLMPVATAIGQGVYGSVQFSTAQRAQLDATFPTGVCDYARGDARRP